MIKGYETREEMIRDHWRRYGFHWNFKKLPCLSIAIRHKQYPYMSIEEAEDPPTLNTDYKLEFTTERGTFEGQPAIRVVCEGIVVEQGSLPHLFPSPSH